jgi:SAM-dependent methyltransferase
LTATKCIDKTGAVTEPDHPHPLLTRAAGALAWDVLYSAGPPDWDIGRPQPAFRALAETGAIRGRVLDVGCGTGEHVLMCAARGLPGTGIDLAETALDQARAKADQRGLTARFRWHDARALPELGERFDTVLDCGLFAHVLVDDPADRAAYLSGLRAVLPAGGRYFLLGFRESHAAHRALPAAELTALFADGWRVDRIGPSAIGTARRDVPAWLLALTRTGSPC